MDDWNELQRHLARVKKEAEASIHEALAAMIRGNYGEAINCLEGTQVGLKRIDEENNKFY